MDSIIKMLNKTLDYFSHELIKDALYITVISNLYSVKCPDCGVESNKVHSILYKKSFQDLPIQDKKVILIIKNRNMFCINQECKWYTFSEKFNFLDPKA